MDALGAPGVRSPSPLEKVFPPLPVVERYAGAASKVVLAVAVVGFVADRLRGRGRHVRGQGRPGG